VSRRTLAYGKPALLQSIRRESWLYALSVAQAGTVLVFLNFAGALPLIQADWQLNNTQAGAIQAAGQVGYLLSVLVVSSLADYLSPERLVLGGALTAGLANLGFAFFADDVVSAVALRALVGVGVAGVYMPGVNLISRRTSPARRGRAVGIFVAAFSFGTAASIALSGTLAARFGWRVAFVLTSAGPFIGAVTAGRMLTPTRLASPAPPATAASTYSLVRDRPALLAILVYAAHVWELFGIRSWLAAFFAASLTIGGASLAQATSTGATAAGLGTLLGASATAIAAGLSDRLGRLRTVAIIMIGSVAGTLGLGFAFGQAWPLVATVGLVTAAVANADSATLSTLLTEIVPPRVLGRTLAVYSSAGFLAGTISPLAVGAVLDQSDAYPWRWAFGMLALGSFVALFVVFHLHRLRRRAAAARQQVAL
ncbi:MAG: MFS transporter, partial [Anaerolineales bacterium]